MAGDEDALYAALERVADRASFLAFVRRLIADREDEVAKEHAHPSSPYGPGANGWENGAIETYLDAAVAWAEAPATAFPEAPSWRTFARFLYAGKHYE